MSKLGFVVLEHSNGALYEYVDGTKVSGLVPGSCLRLAHLHSHLGLVIDGEVLLNYRGRRRLLGSGDHFSVRGPAILTGKGSAVAISVKGFEALNACGGPLEENGRLRYIDGSTDTLLIPPIKKGDPCLNHLHFPPGVVQTKHTHPSIRVNIVYRGWGLCVLSEDEEPVELRPGHISVMLPETVHGFITKDSVLDVVTFHPDSDTGMTDNDHPMVNRTFVDGISAQSIEDIRTQPQETSP